MTIVSSEFGDVLLLKYMLGYANNPGLKIHLYDNYTGTPQPSDPLSLYASYEPNSDPAYTSISILGASWTASTIGGIATAYSTVAVFSLSMAQSVTGYYVTDNTSSNLLWMEQLSTGPINVPVGGDRVLINPAIQLQ